MGQREWARATVDLLIDKATGSWAGSFDGGGPGPDRRPDRLGILKD